MRTWWTFDSRDKSNHPTSRLRDMISSTTTKNYCSTKKRAEFKCMQCQFDWLHARVISTICNWSLFVPQIKHLKIDAALLCYIVGWDGMAPFGAKWKARSKDRFVMCAIISGHRSCSEDFLCERSDRGRPSRPEKGQGWGLPSDALLASFQMSSVQVQSPLNISKAEPEKIYGVYPRNLTESYFTLCEKNSWLTMFWLVRWLWLFSAVFNL